MGEVLSFLGPTSVDETKLWSHTERLVGSGKGPRLAKGRRCCVATLRGRAPGVKGKLRRDGSSSLDRSPGGWGDKQTGESPDLSQAP